MLRVGLWFPRINLFWESLRVALGAEQALEISNSEFQYHFKRTMTLAIYFT